jgi:hypothetical protein
LLLAWRTSITGRNVAYGRHKFNAEVTKLAASYWTRTGARWGEIDMDAKLWIVPADRIKGGKEHSVPLSARAVASLRKMKPGGADVFVFPGGKSSKPLSENGMLAHLERMKRDDLTAHGFRSTVRDWAAEQAITSAKLLRWGWRMSLATRWKRPTAAAIYSQSVSGSWTIGRNIAAP